MAPEFIALAAALFYAGYSVTARLGMRDSNPLTAACVGLSVRTVLLWSAVYLSGGAPAVEMLPLMLFVLLGFLQTATSLLTFTGIERMGAARAEPLRNSYPLWSAIIAIGFLHERAGLAVLGGTLLVVLGVALISWRPGALSSAYRWWHAVFPLLAGFFAGVAFPVRRYAFSISNEPLFFAAVLAIVSLVSLGPYRVVAMRKQRPVWRRRAVGYFLLSGCCETLGALFSLIAVSLGAVVVVSPIVATTPFWTLLLTVLCLRGVESVRTRTVAGTICVVTGTVLIVLRG